MRTLTGAMDTALAAQSVTALYLVEMLLDSGTLRFNSSGRMFNWNGFDWTGAGQLGRIDATSETTTGEVPGIKMELTGLPSANVSLVLSEHVQGRTVNIYVALVDAAGAIIASPVLEWSGLMDQMSIADPGETSTIAITAESRLIDYQRARVKRFNSADQQRDYPTDTFFNYVETMVEKTLVWPSKDWWKQ